MKLIGQLGQAIDKYIDLILRPTNEEKIVVVTLVLILRGQTTQRHNVPEPPLTLRFYNLKEMKAHPHYSICTELSNDCEWSNIIPVYV